MGAVRLEGPGPGETHLAAALAIRPDPRAAVCRSPPPTESPAPPMPTMPAEPPARSYGPAAHEQRLMDRLVAHPPILASREQPRQHHRDLLGRPVRCQQPGHRQRELPHQLARLPTSQDGT